MSILFAKPHVYIDIHVHTYVGTLGMGERYMWAWVVVTSVLPSSSQALAQKERLAAHLTAQRLQAERKQEKAQYERDRAVEGECDSESGVCDLQVVVFDLEVAAGVEKGRL